MMLELNLENLFEKICELTVNVLKYAILIKLCTLMYFWVSV